MCLEEMLGCDIPQGALYYGEIRRREIVPFTPELRKEVETALADMHRLYQRGHTPKVRPQQIMQCLLAEGIVFTQADEKEIGCAVFAKPYGGASMRHFQ